MPSARTPFHALTLAMLLGFPGTVAAEDDTQPTVLSFEPIEVEASDPSLDLHGPLRSLIRACQHALSPSHLEEGTVSLRWSAHADRLEVVQASQVSDASAKRAFSSCLEQESPALATLIGDTVEGATELRLTFKLRARLAPSSGLLGALTQTSIPPDTALGAHLDDVLAAPSDERPPGAGGAGRRGSTLIDIGDTEPREPPSPVQIGLELKEVRGELEPVLLYRILRRNLNQTRFCYERSLREHPELEGSIEASWRVDTQGRAHDVTLDVDGLDHEPLSACMQSRILRWRFPTADQDSHVRATWSMGIDATSP